MFVRAAGVRAQSNNPNFRAKAVYRFLKVCDTAHDFFRAPSDFKHVRQFMPLEISPMLALDGRGLVDALAACKSFTFEADAGLLVRVANPLMGAHILSDARSDALHPWRQGSGVSMDAALNASFGTSPVFQVDTTANPLLGRLLGAVATVSDANLFDAATCSASQRVGVDARPTGKIYLFDDSPYQIELFGLGGAERGSPNGRVDVLVTETDTEGEHAKKREIRLRMSDLDASKWCSRRAIAEDRRPSPFEACSQQLRHAIKRAGDWGQVEHAKRYGKVFVTADKMAAMYAWYREVPFMFTRGSTMVLHTPLGK